jgi:hypothetical protein
MRAFALLLVLWTLAGVFFGVRYAESLGGHLAAVELAK